MIWRYSEWVVLTFCRREPDERPEPEEALVVSAAASLAIGLRERESVGSELDWKLMPESVACDRLCEVCLVGNVLCMARIGRSG